VLSGICLADESIAVLTFALTLFGVVFSLHPKEKISNNNIS
jgi:hypothetical protein